MNQKYRIVSAFLVFSLAILACSININDSQTPLKSEDRMLNPFTAITVDGGAEVILVRGTENKVNIQAPENILSKITSDVTNGTLTLSYKNLLKFSFGWDRIIYTITFVDLNSLVIDGGASVKAADLNLAAFKLDVNGGASIDFTNLTLQDFSVTLNGGASLKATGLAPRQSFTVNGAAHVDTQNLKGEDVSVTINGTGDATVWATKTLNLNLQGAYSLSYYGDHVLQQNLAGAGVVKSLGVK